MRVAFYTLGCKLNSTETAAMQRQFAEYGHQVVEFGSDADVLVVNTCTVTVQADTECRKVIRKGLRGAPGAQVVVTGCYAQLQPETIASMDGVVAVVGTSDKMNIVRHLPEYIDRKDVSIHVADLTSSTEFTGARSNATSSRTRAFLKLQDGCDYSCSFCTIPIARGPSRSMEMDQIRQELIAIQSEGYHECVLTGINLGEYRSSSDHRFIDVLRLVHDMELSIRVRIGSIEPNTLRDEVIDVWQNTETIVPHLHMPLQSGSDALLRLMRRRYNSSLYRDRVESFVSRFSDPGIGIDVITGFPGETEQLFIETVDFLQSIPWTYLHVFTYSERDDTPAASAEGKVDIAERRRRTNVLRAISDERTQQFHRSQLGKHKIFLPEGYDAEVGCWNGWTENHVKAWMAGPFELPKIRYAVKLESLYRDGIFVTPSRSGVSE